MSLKEFFKLTKRKLVTFSILIIIGFFVLPIPTIIPYSPELGAEYVSHYGLRSFIMILTMDWLGGPQLYLLSYIIILIYIILLYTLSCIIVSKFFKTE